MNKLSDILWKIFTTFVVFSCHDISDAGAEDYVQTHTLCRAGYYVAKCGTNNVGTYWLKGYVKSSTNMSSSMATNTQTTVAERAGILRTVLANVTNSDDYYDYSGTNNVENLRRFFAGDKELVFTTLAGMRTSVVPDVYLDNRDGLLAATCDPTQVQISCAKCPGLGTIPASTVDITYDTASLVARSWNFHTIADCYMQEFSDSTGIFEYVNDNNETQTCYYSPEISGDALVTGNSTINSQYVE